MYVVKIIFGILLLYCMVAPISMIPYIIGMFQQIFFLPIEIISHTLYPVGPLPYIFWIAGIGFVIGHYCFNLATKHT